MQGKGNTAGELAASGDRASGVHAGHGPVPLGIARRCMAELGEAGNYRTAKEHGCLK